MTKLIVLFSILISFSAYCNEESMPERPDYWRVLKKDKDTTINIGESVINFIVLNKFGKKPLKDVEIHLNSTQYMGKTDSTGHLKIKVKSTKHRICADALLGNSFIKYFEFKSQYNYTFEIVMSPIREVRPNYGHNETQPKKPVIYLYPKHKQNVNVKVIPKDEFLFTYPKYTENGWDVIAYPDGEIEYENKTYNYLFWEGVSSEEYTIDMTKGFEVDSDTLIEFFEHTLTKIGLTTEEQADFITYWGPKLQENQLNFIHFDFNESYEKNIAQLKVTPQPNSFIRIFMTYHYIDELEYTEQQTIPTYKRKGFTVVEWGGSYRN